jgi:hypothetical protein
LQKPDEHQVVLKFVTISPWQVHALAVMDTTTLLLGAGQLALTIAIGYITYLTRRDSKRSSLVALVTVLNELREKNGKALTAFFALMTTDAFKHGDEQLRAGLIDSTNRLRAIQGTVTEALLDALRKCDSEWGLAGRLHTAFRSQVGSLGDKEWDRLAEQHQAH